MSNVRGICLTCRHYEFVGDKDAVDKYCDFRGAVDCSDKACWLFGFCEEGLMKMNK